MDSVAIAGVSIAVFLIGCLFGFVTFACLEAKMQMDNNPSSTPHTEERRLLDILDANI